MQVAVTLVMLGLLALVVWMPDQCRALEAHGLFKRGQGR